MIATSPTTRMEEGGDDDGKMIQTTTSLPPAAEGTETSDIGDHLHDDDGDDDDDEDCNTKTTKKTEERREVRFQQSADVRYIETKDEMPNREDYWLTPYDLYQIKNDVQKALRQQCPSVQKYQPHEVIAIQRKFKSLSKNILRQQDKNNRHFEELQKKLQKQEEEVSKRKKKKTQNNIFGFLFNNNNNKNKDEKNDENENDDCQVTLQKLKDELKTFREHDAPTNIAQLYRDITKPDVEDAIQVASQLEQDVLL